MPFPKTYVDAMLLNWGDRLFHEPLRHVRAPRLARGQLHQDAQRMRERLARTLRRAHEVMVKITNKASSAQGMGAVRRHLRYISRNGRVELEDQDGQVMAGTAALHDLVDEWRRGGWGIPEESRRREVFNVLFSMPPGTDRQAVRDAVRAFAADEFGDERRYVFAAHDDEAHPHVHLCVQVRGPDGRRLNPRKSDLQRWRERFAEELRERGVDANATPRRTRGEIRRYPKQAVVHMMARGETPRYWRMTIGDDAQRVLWNAHQSTLDVWREIARVMAGSEDATDRKVAVEIADFARTMPVLRDRVEIALQRGQSIQQARKNVRDRSLLSPPSIEEGPFRM